jgi:hypothetical protein
MTSNHRIGGPQIMKYIKALLSIFLFVACFPSVVGAQASTIALVQHTSKDAGTVASATLAFNSNNTAGNWIGVCVRAGHSGELFTVVDSRGNTYHKAVQFNVTVDAPNGNTLGIFYAENIASGPNTITVTATASATMRFAIVEYSGVASANSLEVSAMAQGNGVSPNSGNATTTLNGDLLLGAISTANPSSYTAGTGFITVESVPAKPGTKLFAEQQIKAIAGPESTHATLAAADSWGAVLAGFKPGAGVVVVPNITSLSPASGVVGTPVTIAGTNFGTAVGTVAFNGTAGTPTSWTTTRVVVPVPAGATSGNVVLTDPGVPSNGVAFTVTTPDTTPPAVAITSPANNATLSGTTTITASATDNVAVASVQFKVDNTNLGAAVLSAPYSTALSTTTLTSGNHILTAVATDTSGNATTSAAVTVNVSNTVAAPSITSLNPTSGPVGASVTISGVNLGATQAASTVKFNGTTATPSTWSATSVVVPVPSGATTGNVVVTVGSTASNGVNFTVPVPAPSIASLNPTSGLIGASVTITGANFGSTRGSSAVNFNGIGATPTNWTASSVVVPVPAGATTGNVVVTVGGVASNGVIFTVTVPGPSITSLNPPSGLVGASVTISGANFGSAQGTSSVSFNGIAAAPASWGAANVVVAVPAGATTGSVVVTVGGAASNGVSFTVTAPAPSLTGLNPTSGLVGASVTITGANFGTTQGTSTVKFNGTAATPASWSATSIATTVPNGSVTGNVVVVVGGVASNGVGFTVTVPAPSISTLNPASGLVGSSVTITGVNFGATQGTSTVKFNGTTATSSSWSATSLIASVPSGASTGNVVITVGGAASNGQSFTVVADTTPPVVNITTPVNNASVATTITLTATATDPDSPIAFVQFLIDGLNVGAQQTIAPYSVSFDTTTLPNGTHTLTAVAQDPSANQGTSAAIVVTISNGTGSTIGPLKQSTVNSRYLVAPAGNAVFLSGSHTWNDFQDTNTNSSPAALDFNSYVAFLKSNGQNATILWHKDLPEYCGWNFSGSTWTMTPWPWLRPGPGVATDSKPKFDLTQFNQAYFDRLRARVQQLQQNGIYSIVQLFDGNQLTSARCSTDGYAFSGPNNINGVSDGYSSGAAGVNSVTMTAKNAITNFQDAYLKKVVDTLNDLPTVIWEIAEEQPAASMTWWAPHMMGLVRTYETGGTFEGTAYPGKPFQHPVGIGSLNATTPNDATLYSSTADWIAPTINSNFSNQFPSNASTNNRSKVVINDSDHSLGYKSFTNSDGSIQDQNLRGYLWENLTSGAEGVVFMDPYEIFWQGSPARNTCLNPLNQVCTGGVDAKLNKFRTSMGYLQSFANSNLNLLKMTPQNSLSSTGFCLADNSAAGAEYVVYAPSGGTFTVNLSATARPLNVTWFNPATGVSTAVAAITGGSNKSFTAPFSGDAVLYIVDAAGHN